MSAPGLTIVVAVKDAEENLSAIVDRLAPTLGSVELIFVFAGDAPPAWKAPAGVVTLMAAQSSLIPHLWRDGIVRAKGGAIALMSAHCIPAENWIDALHAADVNNHVGVGGVIDLDARCSLMHRSIYLLRYLRFVPPMRASVIADIAADNAIYRRADVLAHPDLLEEGFWEPSFHRRFARAGQTLFLDPRMRVSYRGRETGRDFARQRFAHGREYGASRARSKPRLQRLALVLASPVAPVVIFARIVIKSFRRFDFALSLFLSLPWLIWFIAAWSLGEAFGYASAVFAPTSSRASAHD
jgi:hypothetical protein